MGGSSRVILFLLFFKLLPKHKEAGSGKHETVHNNFGVPDCFLIWLSDNRATRIPGGVYDWS